MSKNEKVMSALSNEHYKALASVADRLAEILGQKNNSAYVNTECIDSLSRIVNILAAFQITSE